MSQVRPYIMDMGSTNGTYLNNERLDPERYYELLNKVLNISHAALTRTDCSTPDLCQKDCHCRPHGCGLMTRRGGAAWEKSIVSCGLQMTEPLNIGICRI